MQLRVANPDRRRTEGLPELPFPFLEHPSREKGGVLPGMPALQRAEADTLTRPKNGKPDRP